MSAVDDMTLSCKEEKAIEELQLRMKDGLLPSMYEDEKLTYFRFLKARDFDVDKAEKMLRKHIEFRKINQLETILEDFKPTEVFFKYFDPSLLGYDKDGDMVRYTPGGTFLIQEIMNCTTMSRFMKHWYWFIERNLQSVKEENRKTGKKGYRCTMIFDADQILFSTLLSRLTIDLILRFINDYQDNYPERMKASYVINAPPYFVMFFSIIKRVMSAAMLKKIHIFGNSGWKEKLTEMICPDDLPAFLGGNLKDPDGDPRCKTFISQGGRIPAYYFLTEKERYFEDMSKVKNVLIPPLEKEEICVDLDKLGTLLLWEFLVKSKDVGLGIFFEVSKCERTELIPIKRYSTPDGTEMDSLKCRSTGKYILVFDNSYSWRSPKEVQYIIRVVNPTL